MNIGQALQAALAHIDQDSAGEIRKAQRAARVKDMWADLVDQSILDHTNGVYIFQDEPHGEGVQESKRVLQVYVDEAIYASELNAQRELIRWKLQEKFGEEVDEFRISVSRSRYRNYYPFKEQESTENQFNHELNQDDIKHIDELCEGIENARIQRAFREAMMSNLRWNQTFFEENKNEN